MLKPLKWQKIKSMGFQLGRKPLVPAFYEAEWPLTSEEDNPHSVTSRRLREDRLIPSFRYKSSQMTQLFTTCYCKHGWNATELRNQQVRT